MARGTRAEENNVVITDAVVKRASEKAILIVTKDGEEVWLPRSQLREGSQDLVAGKDKHDITMTEWIAGEKGLASDD